MGNKPTIDGVLSEGEWAEASTVTGFFEGRILASRQVRAYASYDDDFLYLAITSPVGPEPLVAAQNDGDSKLWMDDAVEIYIAPPGDKAYKIVFNSRGAAYTARYDATMGNEDVSWKSGIEVQCKADAATWVAELRVPFKNVSSGAPAEKEVWRFNIGRDWKQPMQFVAWSPTTFYADTNTFGFLQFSKAAPSIRIGGIAIVDGKLKITGSVGSGRADTNNVQARLAVTASGKEVYKTSGSYIPGQDQQNSFAFEKDLFDTGADQVALDITNEKSGETLYRFVYSSPAPLASSAVDVKFVPFEYQRQALVEVNIPAIANRSQGFKGTVKLLTLENRKPVVTAELAPFKGSKARATFDSKNVVPGQYVIEVAVRNQAGVVTYEKEIPLTKPADDWLTSPTEENLDAVPAPWTPMSSATVQGAEVVKCWGREYRFDKSPFPTAIVTAGRQILASPVTLDVKTERGIAQYKPRSSKITGSKPEAVVVQSTGDMEGIKVDSRVRTEYDGLMIFDVTLTPKSPVKVSDIALSIPLKGEYAKYIHVPPTEIISGKDYFSGATGKANGWKREAPFSHYMWTGNEECGVQWFAESNRNWEIGDNTKTIALERRDETMHWRINMVQKPIVLAKPMKFSFGLHVTPVKPRPSGDWRGYGLMRNISLIWTMKNQSSTYFGYAKVPEEGKQWHKELVDALHSEKKKAIQYLLVTMLSEGSPEYQYYHNEWQATPGFTDSRSADVVAMGKAIHGMCPENPGWIKWRTDTQVEFVKENNLDGVYCDNSWAWYCENEFHGCQGKLPILANRRLYEAQYKKLKKLGQEKLIIVHCSSGLVMPLLSFSDGYMVGEQFSGQVTATDFYMNHMDWFKAEAMGRPLGLVPMILPMARGPWANKELTENFMGLALLHDASNVAMMGTLQVEVTRQIWSDLDKFGITKTDVEFLPFWTPSKKASLSSSKALLSTYVRKGEGALFVVANLEQAPVKVDVNYDPKAMGLDNKELVFSDFYTKATLSPGIGKLALEVPARSVQVIELSPAERTAGP